MDAEVLVPRGRAQDNADRARAGAFRRMQDPKERTGRAEEERLWRGPRRSRRTRHDYRLTDSAHRDNPSKNRCWLAAMVRLWSPRGSVSDSIRSRRVNRGPRIVAR
jgi:hypothetical protein